MKRQFFMLSILLLLCTHSYSQQIFSEVGRVTTHFDYKDSYGNNPLELFPGSGNSYQAGYRMNLSKHIHLSLGVLFNRYLSRGSDPVYDHRYEWDVQYIGPSAGIELEFLKSKGFSLFGRLAAEPQLLLRGSQTIDRQIHPLKGVEQFDRPFFFYKGGLGMNYCADTKLAVSLKYQIGKGAPLGSSADGEVLKLNTHTISIGLLWNMRRCRYCSRRSFH